MGIKITASRQIETETLLACPLCASEAVVPWCEGYDRLLRITQQKFQYSRCSHCGVTFQSTRPVEMALSQFYPSHYQPYLSTDTEEGLKPNGAEKQKKRKGLVLKFFKILYKILVHILPDRLSKRLRDFYCPVPNGVLLDFGCGSDQFLNQAKKAGWCTIGLDFSPQVVEQIQKKGHVGLLVSPTVWEKIEDYSIDFVRMSHVLEHLPQPKPVLTQLRVKIKPGGKLHVAVPNPASWTASLFKSCWFGLECPRHLILFHPEGLKRILLEAGFSDVTLIHETLTKDFIRSIGYWLYDRGLIQHETIQHAIENEIFNFFVYPWARLASLMKRSDRIHAFIRK